MNAKQKDAAKDKFMEDDKVSVMICNIMAAGVGLSLTASNALVFNSMDYVPASNMQFEDRVHRLSSKEDVDIFYQIFNNTEYERMWNIVLRKSMIIEQVIKKEDDK
jgi:SWI/SNF-related matrix-associated actin-dependent regulator 1 of chromatin subfamily A